MKQVLFLVHGMGISADGPLGSGDRVAWAKDVEAILREALKAFPGVAADDLKIVPILYDDVFISHVTRWAELSKALAKTPLAPLTNWMDKTDEPDFLYSNIGDVVLYRAFAEVREHVLTHVARQFADQIDALGRADVQYSVLAHSLGTAVAHDAIQKLASVGIDGSTVFQPPHFRFANFFALANVSRLVWVTDESFYQDTRVRPPDCGLDADQCAVMHYATFRHIADPVPSIVRFTRKNWNAGRFWSVDDLAHFKGVNVHCFTHYLAHPTITNLLFRRLFGKELVPDAVMRTRLTQFEPYASGVAGEAQKIAVKTVAAIIDGLSASSNGRFVDDFDDVGKALLQAKKAGLFA